MDTWISHLHHRGIPTVIHLPPATKTRHAAFGMLGTYQSPYQFLKATLEQFDRYDLPRMGSSWRWQSQLTLYMSMMRRMGMRRSKRSISLGRSQVCHSALTLNLSSLECGTARMVAFFSTTEEGAIRTLTLYYESSYPLLLVIYCFMLVFCK